MLQEEMAKIRWWHTIDLGHGMVTPGEGDNLSKIKTLQMPEDLTGLSVLDVGAWDGFFSFESERRGAKRVLATDLFCWDGGGWGTKAGFDLAKKTLNSKVEEMRIDVLDLSPSNVGTFDVVLFLGVLYHMRHPLLALERIFSVTKGLLILETHVDKLWDRRPAMVYYPGSELADDPTNWWGPNPAAVEAMLKTAGFTRVRKITETPSLPRIVYRAARGKLMRHGAFFQTVQQTRDVFHAWR